VEQLKGLKKGGCWPTKVEECQTIPFSPTVQCLQTKCHNVETGPSCRNVTAPSCTLVERTECIPERQICTDVTKQVPVQTTAHCPVPPQQNCKPVETTVCKVVKKKKIVCTNVCKPVDREVCQIGAPVQECTLVPMTVTYKVPKKVCSHKINTNY